MNWLYIAMLIPFLGATTGSDAVWVVGKSFDCCTKVYFGDVPAPNVQWYGPDRLLVTTPPHAAGWVDITAVEPNGAWSVLQRGFLYVPAPRIERILPEGGSWRGDTCVTITGSDFWEGIEVFFGSVRARRVQRIDSGTILALNPPMWPGTVDVEVRNPPPYGLSNVGRQKTAKFTFTPGSSHSGGCSYRPTARVRYAPAVAGSPGPVVVGSPGAPVVLPIALPLVLPISIPLLSRVLRRLARRV
jgi:hypothetical protein